MRPCRRRALRRVHPLLLNVRDIQGRTLTRNAINEVSMLRETHQAAKLAISIDGKERPGDWSRDGLLVARRRADRLQSLPSAGRSCRRTAAAHIMPISSLPRRWRGALLPNSRGPRRVSTRATARRGGADHTEFSTSSTGNLEWIAPRLVCCTIRTLLDERFLREACSGLV